MASFPAETCPLLCQGGWRSPLPPAPFPICDLGLLPPCSLFGFLQVAWSTSLGGISSFRVNRACTLGVYHVPANPAPLELRCITRPPGGLGWSGCQAPQVTSVGPSLQGNEGGAGLWLPTACEMGPSFFRAQDRRCPSGYLSPGWGAAAGPARPGCPLSGGETGASTAGPDPAPPGLHDSPPCKPMHQPQLTPSASHFLISCINAWGTAWLLVLVTKALQVLE